MGIAALSSIPILILIIRRIRHWTRQQKEQRTSAAQTASPQQKQEELPSSAVLTATMPAQTASPQQKQEELPSSAVLTAAMPQKKRRNKPPGVSTPVAPADDVAACIELLRTAGVVRINHVLDRQTSAALRETCSNLVDAGLSAVATGEAAATDVLAPHLLKGNQYGHRHDVKLSFSEEEIRSALRAALAVLGPLLTAVVSILSVALLFTAPRRMPCFVSLTADANPTRLRFLSSLVVCVWRQLGEDSTLFELSAIAADAGTPAQALHFDFARPPDHPAVLVVFIALQDVTASQGPTFFAPGSHAANFRKAVEAAWSPEEGNASARGQVREQQPLCRPLLSAGDCVVMDSALYHAGGANTTAADRRLLFHFSFARAGAHELGRRTSSLLESLRGKHTLGELMTTIS